MLFVLHEESTLSPNSPLVCLRTVDPHELSMLRLLRNVLYISWITTKKCGAQLSVFR